MRPKVEYSDSAWRFLSSLPNREERRAILRAVIRFASRGEGHVVRYDGPEGPEYALETAPWSIFFLWDVDHRVLKVRSLFRPY